MAAKGKAGEECCMKTAGVETNRGTGLALPGRRRAVSGQGSTGLAQIFFSLPVNPDRRRSG